MIGSGQPKCIKIVGWNLFKFHFKTSFDTFFNFQNSIRAHVRHRAFATLQIEWYRVVDYDRKWYTKIYEVCILELARLSYLYQQRWH